MYSHSYPHPAFYFTNIETKIGPNIKKKLNKMIIKGQSNELRIAFIFFIDQNIDKNVI